MYTENSPCVDAEKLIKNMEKLQDQNLIKFRPNTLQEVRKEFNLDKPGIIEQSLDILEQWLLKQDHLVKKDYPRTYLERCLVNCKGSVEKTKTKLDKMSTIRTLMPQYFESFDAFAEFEPYKDGIWHTLLPQLTPRNERVYIMKNIGFKHDTFLSFYKHFIKILDYMNAYDYNTGFHIILDYTELNVYDFIQKMNPTQIQHWSEITLNGFAMRVRSFQVITPSTMIDMLVTIFKAALSPKLGKRIYVFKDLATWENHQINEIKIPKDLLPEDYGGLVKPLKELHGELMTALSSKEFIDYLKDQSMGVTNENLRSACIFNDQHLGMPGSFRQMTVD